MNETPLEFALERARVGDLPLAFPGKVIADPTVRKLFIADSNHNRIVMTDLSGTLLDMIGSGDRSGSDGVSKRQVLINRREWRLRGLLVCRRYGKSLDPEG